MWKAVKRSWTAAAEPAEAEKPAEEPCGTKLGFEDRGDAFQLGSCEGRRQDQTPLGLNERVHFHVGQPDKSGRDLLSRHRNAESAQQLSLYTGHEHSLSTKTPVAVEDHRRRPLTAHYGFLLGALAPRSAVARRERIGVPSAHDRSSTQLSRRIGHATLARWLWLMDWSTSLTHKAANSRPIRWNHFAAGRISPMRRGVVDGPVGGCTIRPSNWRCG